MKLCLLCCTFKSKPIHEKIMIRFINEVRNSPLLQDISSSLNINLSAYGINAPQDEANRVMRRGNFLSPAIKLKVVMQACRTDESKKAQIAKEFEDLVSYIINIDSRTEEAFKGAFTIKNADFI